MDKSIPVTSSLQDYLEVILNLSQEDGAARVTDIASSLNIAKASVSQALSVLKKQGLIQQTHYGPVILTAKGKDYARKIRYRHRVIRFFLIEVLGVSSGIAERDACLLEHELSSQTFECLIEFLEEREIAPPFHRETFRGEED